MPAHPQAPATSMDRIDIMIALIMDSLDMVTSLMQVSDRVSFVLKGILISK
jgi:hypothetical protein